MLDDKHGLYFMLALKPEFIALIQCKQRSCNILNRSKQGPKDRVLWVLRSGSGKMSMRRLRNNTGLAKAELNDVLEELKQDGKIIIRAGRRKIVLLKV